MTTPISGISTPRAGGPPNTILDTRLIQKIESYANEKEKWKQWSFVLVAVVSAQLPDIQQALEVAANLSSDLNNSVLTTEQQRVNAQFYTLLTMVLKGEALDVLMNVPMGNGFECWRRLKQQHEPRTAAHKRSQLIMIINGTNLSGDYEARLNQWERRIREYETGGATISEETRMAVLHSVLSPTDIREHLTLQATRLTTYIEMKEEIRRVMTSRQGQAASTSTDMEIGGFHATGEGRASSGQ